MFALLALICFVLALFGIGHLGFVDLVLLGWCFIATHLLLGDGVSIPWPRRSRSAS